MLPQKRAKPEPSSQPKLSELESKLYEVIKSKESLGIWTNDVKKQAVGSKPADINKAIQSLIKKDLIKEVSSVKHKSRKIVMAKEFEPSDEISGGTWYQNGSLDNEFITLLRQFCKKQIVENKIATREMVQKGINDPPSGRRPFTTEITLQQISEIMDLLVLDREIERVRSSGQGDFARVQAGKECFRVLKSGEAHKDGGLASVPCGVCPRIRECTPNGVISPVTCVYFNKWLAAADF